MKSSLLGKFIYLHVYAHFINNYWESKLYSPMCTLLICFLADWHCPCNQFLFQISTLTNLLFYLLHHFLPYPWDTHVGCWASLPKCSYQASLQSKCAKCEKEWGGGETPLWVWEFSLHNTAFLQYLIQMITSTITKMFIFIWAMKVHLFSC